MINKEVSPGFNAIQIFRLKCALNLLKSLDVYSIGAFDVINWVQANSENFLGIEKLNLSSPEDVEKALGKLRKQKNPASDARRQEFNSIVDYQKYRSPEGGLLSEQGKQEIYRIFNQAVEEDVAARKVEYAQHLEEIKALLDPELRLAQSGSRKSDQEDLMRFSFVKILKEIPEERKKQARLIILNAIEARYGQAIETLEQVIKLKSAHHAEQGGQASALQENVAMLASDIGLSDIDRDILIFLGDAPTSGLFRLFEFSRKSKWERDDYYLTLATALGYSEAEIEKAMSLGSVLREGNLIVSELDHPKDEKKKGKKGGNDDGDEDEDKPIVEVVKLYESSGYGLSTSTRAYRIPDLTLQAFREKHNDVAAIVGRLLGKRDDNTPLTLDGDFPYLRTEIEARIAVIEDFYTAEIASPGRKGRLMVGEAGSGKNTIFRLICQTIDVKGPGGEKLPVRGYLVGLAEARDAKAGAKQLTGKERVYAWATADYIAARINETVLKTGEGSLIVLGIDEGDKDILNPEVTGSKAKEGIKDFADHFLLNLRTPAMILANVSHTKQEHIIRRLGPPLQVGVPPINSRLEILKGYCSKHAIPVPVAVLRDINERNPATPGVIEACVEDVAAQSRRFEGRAQKPPSETEIVSWLDRNLKAVRRANLGGLRPTPIKRVEMPEFDFGICNADKSMPHFEKIAREWIKSGNFKGQTVSLTGPIGSGKTQFIRWFAHEAGKRIITIPDASDAASVANAVDEAIRDNGLIVVDENGKSWGLTQDDSIYVFAKQELDSPVFFTLSYDEMPTEYGEMGLYFHFDYLDRDRIFAAWKKYIDLPLDERIANIDHLTPRVFSAVGRQVSSLKQVNGHISANYVLGLFMQRQGYASNDPAHLSPEREML